MALPWTKMNVAPLKNKKNVPHIFAKTNFESANSKPN